jgi:MFS family permease
VKRPLEGSYWTAFAIVMIALCPNIVVTTAWTLITKPIGHSLGLGSTGLEVTEGLANASYAFGALVGGFLIQRLRHRPLFLACESLFVLGCVLAIVAPDWEVFAMGRVLQGLATGFLLVVAIPPLVQQFPHTKLPTTAAGVNVAFFGAVCAGPLVGGAGALNLHDWRYLFVGFAVVGVLGIVLGLLSLPDEDAPNPDMRPDVPALSLAAVATFAPFVGTALLVSPARGYASPGFWIPLAVGVAAFVALLVVEYRSENPLAPVKPLSSTIPIFGILVATLAGGVFVTALQLAIAYMTSVSHEPPMDVGRTLWPAVPTALLGALAFFFLIRTRWLFVFVVTGMVAVAGGAAVLLGMGTWNVHTTVKIAAAVLGLGAGATVAPALWMAGFSVSAKLVGRVFALVELIRAEGDYIMAPILRKLSVTSAGPLGPAHGIRHAAGVTTGLGVATIVICLAVWFKGRPRLARPDTRRYIEDGEPGLESPPLF